MTAIIAMVSGVRSADGIYSMSWMYVNYTYVCLQRPVGWWNIQYVMNVCELRMYVASERPTEYTVCHECMSATHVRRQCPTGRRNIQYVMNVCQLLMFVASVRTADGIYSMSWMYVSYSCSSPVSGRPTEYTVCHECMSATHVRRQCPAGRRNIQYVMNVCQLLMFVASVRPADGIYSMSWMYVSYSCSSPVSGRPTEYTVCHECMSATHVRRQCAAVRRNTQYVMNVCQLLMFVASVRPSDGIHSMSWMYVSYSCSSPVSGRPTEYTVCHECMSATHVRRQCPDGRRNTQYVMNVCQLLMFVASVRPADGIYSMSWMYVSYSCSSPVSGRPTDGDGELVLVRELRRGRATRSTESRLPSLLQTQFRVGGEAVSLRLVRNTHIDTNVPFTFADKKHGKVFVPDREVRPL